ncbi:MAG: hypothetical protein J6R99_00240 [Alphaproteobacteria bacterium]|nr:hypothetical protein [Alphaproteobacteria bacterium]
MAKQTAKKTATKTVAKKAVVKKTTAKKTAAKKAPVKVAPAPVVEKLPCGCDKGCACAGKCHKCGGVFKKLVIFLVIFGLGFATAKLCCCEKGRKMMPRPEFENGCLVIKCPKMAQMVPVMDADKNGCVSVEEFKAARKHMRKMKKQHRPQPVQPVVAE